ncbi:MAG: hypothetical protein O3B73_18320 [bacterium]|nr:hypothetical protein [bacterium]
MFFQLALFVTMIVGPVLLAWFKGDVLLNYLERNRKLSLQRRRARITRALPVREEVMAILLDVERKREDIEDRTARALGQFRQVTGDGRALTAHATAAVILDELEAVVLSRESLFHDYLDTACLQSDTLEAVSEEIALLRKVAEPDMERPTPTPGAAGQIMETMRLVEKKRAEIDRRLDRLGRG